MNRLRAILALPFTIAVMIVTIGFMNMLGGRAPRLLSRVFGIGGGCQTHVLIPLVRIQRRIFGVPAWEVGDCVAIGAQPVTKEEIARARAAPELVFYKCICSRPNCRVRDGRFVPRAALPPEILQAVDAVNKES